MTLSRTFTAAAVGALILGAGSTALAQTPYNQTPYNPAPYGQTPYGQTDPRATTDPFAAILNALFGDRTGAQTTLDSEWSRGRRPLYAQRAQLQARIDADVRAGNLSASAGARLSADYDALVQQETRYTADGRVTTQERADLTERYRAFSERYQNGGYDGGSDGGYGQSASVADGQRDFEARVDAAQRNRTLTRAQALRLRSDYQSLVQVEAGYARDGLSAREDQYLRAQVDALNLRVGDGYTGGYGNGNGNGNGGYGQDPYARQMQDIEARIGQGERSGQINRDEGERLRTELGDLTRLDSAYLQDGLNADERAYLTRRFDELDARVRNVRRY